MQCLVTGGAGFIGSHLVDTLIREGHDVVVIDDLSTGKNPPRCVFYNQSICDDLTEIFQRHSFDVVFHLAALPRVQFSFQNPAKSHHANINGTFNVLQHCKQNNVNRFIYSSSSSIYGNQSQLPLEETMIPRPMSPYALQKYIGEQYCVLYHQQFGMETIALRYFSVYGPRQDPTSNYALLIIKFITMLQQKKQPVIYGDGEQTRDFTYVEDVVRANILAATTKNSACFGQTINIGAGNNVSVNSITKKIQTITSATVEPLHAPPIIEPKNTLANIQKASQLLDWKPTVQIDEGLEKMYAFFTNIPQKVHRESRL